MAMNIMTLLQVSPSVIEKSADMAVKDPHGAIITLVSVTVVFIALVILYFAYTLTGKLMSGEISINEIFRKLSRKPAYILPWCRFIAPKKPKCTPTPEEAAAISMALDQELNGETYAAIAMALHQHLNDTVHDMESYIITIKRK